MAAVSVKRSIEMDSVVTGCWAWVCPFVDNLGVDSFAACEFRLKNTGKFATNEFILDKQAQH